MKMTEIMLESKCPLSCLTEGFTVFPQRLLNVRVKDKRAIVADESVRAAVRREEERLGGGRILLRASGTEPLVRVLVEGENAAACERALIKMETALHEADCASGDSHGAV